MNSEKVTAVNQSDQSAPHLTVYSINEAADYLRVHPDTIRRAIARGDLAASQKLGVWRIPAKAVAEAAGEISLPAKKAARR